MCCCIHCSGIHLTGGTGNRDTTDKHSEKLGQPFSVRLPAGAQPLYCIIYSMHKERAASVGRRSLRRSALRLLTPGRRLVVSAHTVSIKGTVMDAVRVSASGEDFWWIRAKEYHRDHTTEQISRKRFIGGVAGEGKGDSERGQETENGLRWWGLLAAGNGETAGADLLKAG